MDFSLSQFAKPQLAPLSKLETDVYSPHQWERMLDYKIDVPFNPVVSSGLYKRAMRDLGSRDLHMKHTRADLGKIPSATSEPSSKEEPKHKAIAAMASWCGYSKRAHADHTKYRANVQTLWCDKDDKGHALCKKTRGFPTYYHNDGSIMKSGYPVKDPKGFYESLK